MLVPFVATALAALGYSISRNNSSSVSVNASDADDSNPQPVGDDSSSNVSSTPAIDTGAPAPTPTPEPEEEENTEQNTSSSENQQYDWTLGNFKSPTTWANQMAKRDWTLEAIDETIETGEQFPAPNYVNPGNIATRYENPTTGKYVVKDNVTNEVLQISGKGFDPPIMPDE